jgi:hypothetical protein
MLDPARLRGLRRVGIRGQVLPIEGQPTLPAAPYSSREYLASTNGSTAKTLRAEVDRLPCISLRCTDTCREKFKSGLADQKLIAVTPTSRRSNRVRPQILGRDGSRSALGQRDLNLGMSRWAQLITNDSAKNESFDPRPATQRARTVGRSGRGDKPAGQHS